jgi:sugar lactone lactonase YvrE
MCVRIAILLVLAAVSSASGECIELKIVKREPFAGGMSFGDVGPYERIVGIAKFAVDPKHPRNSVIIDLDKAPLNKEGKVEFQSDFFILAPKDPSKGNGALLYDVNNRGNKLALAFFNDAPGTNNPSTAEHAGNGFLLRRGYTLVWCGWIGELLPGSDRLLLQAPIATDNCKPITGVVRFEFTSDSAAESLPLSRREGHGSYNPTEKGEKEGTLTYRLHEKDERMSITRDQWTLQRIAPERVTDRVPGTLSQIRCKLKGGFKSGYIYELICECENPIVQGCGFAAVRDLLSFLKHESSEKNPLARETKSPIQYALGFGISQSGRFLRHFVYELFNIDEADRKVFDGLMPHVAGGGLGFFNHRFAQPTRHNGQHEEHLYPADVFPFTYGDEKHRYIGLDGKVVNEERVDGILRKYALQSRFLPFIMHTQSSSEYWNRSGSLVHTDPVGERDSVIPQNVRIYSFGGTQHGPAPDPPKPGNGVNLPNPGNFKPICRALLVALHDWARDGKRPPDSEYPRVGRGFTDLKTAGTHFPKIPGVRYPEVVQQPSFTDLGEGFWKTGIITQEPPRIAGHYRVLVPVTTRFGEVGMLDPLEVAMPLATYTGWNLRKKEIGAEGMLLSLQGSYIPLPRTDAEAKAKLDPRPSIETQYESFAEYLKHFRVMAAEYVQKRWLLQEDADKLIASRVLVHHLFADPKDSLLEPGTKMEKVATGSKFTEGPAIDKDGNLFFSDGANDRIMKRSADGKLSEFRKKTGRTNGMAFDHEGRLLMCQSEGRRVARLEKDGTDTNLADVFDGKNFFAPNDICVGAKGRIYFTDLNSSAKEDKYDLPSGVYRIDAPKQVVRIIEGLGRPNGIALSPDGKLLYVSDRSTQKLHRYKVKENGDVETAGIVYDFSPDRGVDGMRLDVKGNIWAAAGQGKTTGLFVISPEGKLLLHHAVPEFSTNLCFGGKDNKDLYFTASTSVYKFRTTIAGVILPGRQ